MGIGGGGSDSTEGIGNGSDITINGGTVNAIGSYGAGIGGGGSDGYSVESNCNGSGITINGGTITATSTCNGAGIGGGCRGNGSDITIVGGTVTAIGGDYGAGIGGGSGDGNYTRISDGSNITIIGGTITAIGGQYGAGIGGGEYGNSSDIAISGGLVTATGTNGGAGIGGGSAMGIKNKFGIAEGITISGGTVTVAGSTNADGIGSGSGGSASGIMIYNASVKADSISVTPTNASDDYVYLYKVPDTTEGMSIYVDGTAVIASVAHHADDDTNQYLYLPESSKYIYSNAFAYAMTYSNSTFLVESIADMEITDAATLRMFADIVNLGHTEINGTLTADIALDSGDWTPVGIADCPYQGTFDGNEHIISGIYCNNDKSAGLFGFCTNSVIQNLGVINSSVSGNGYVGGICGHNGGTISNCYNTGSIISESGYVGGICGYNNGIIINCCDNSGTGVGNDETDNGVTQKTDSEFASGEVAYLLNSIAGDTVWYQTIGVNATPVFAGEAVCYDSTNGYYNNWFAIETTLAGLISVPQNVETITDGAEELVLQSGDPVLTVIIANSGDTAVITKYTVTVMGGTFDAEEFTPTKSGLFDGSRYYMAQIVGDGIVLDGDYSVVIEVAYTVGDMVCGFVKQTNTGM